MKWIVGILLVIFILICGCSSNQSEVAETNVTIVTPTPVAVTATWIQTVGPTPTPTNDVRECYNKSLKEPPSFCYDLMYWVKPTSTPPNGMGYTARVSKNNGCINFNKTSDECEGWGDDTFNVLFLHNLTIVKNLTSVNNTELVASVVYYNKTYNLTEIDGESFDSFIDVYWDKTYPSQPYNKTLFKPNESTTVVPVDTFNPDGF